MGDHYLPQMLLKNFCDRSGLLWVARKGGLLEHRGGFEAG